MSRFFVQRENINKENRIIKIDGPDANHIACVLRMKTGDTIEISDGYANGYMGTIKSLSKSEVIVTYEKEERIISEPTYKVTLFQGLPKKDKMELIVQKAVELGVTRIVPVEMERSIVKLDSKKKDKKVLRWNEISKGAAEQSGRGIIPEVTSPVTFKQALEIANNLDNVIVPYELEKDAKGTKEILASIDKNSSIGIFIGPEGGFGIKEIEACDEIGKRISLGKRILRTETAGLATLAMLILNFEL